MKKNWRKDEKSIYLPNSKPELIIVPAMKFISTSGVGNPNSEEFSKKVEALYSFSYKLRMSYKWENPPAGYYEYTVYPLEGVWDIADITKYKKGVLDKDNLSYRIMIRQPGFMSAGLFAEVMNVLGEKSPNPFNDSLELIDIEEGPCIQMMHIGPYDTESETFAVMENFTAEYGYVRIGKDHREIYLNDPRKTEPEKLKTVLRFRIKI